MNTLLISLYPPNQYGGKAGGVVILLNDILTAAPEPVDLVVYRENEGNYDLPEGITFIPWNRIAVKDKRRLLGPFRYSLFKDYGDYVLDVGAYDKIILYPYFSSLFQFQNMHGKVYTIGMDSGPLLYMRGMLNHRKLKYRFFSFFEFVQALKIDRYAVSLSEKVFTVGEADAEFYRSVLLADAAFVHHPVSSLINGRQGRSWQPEEKLSLCFPGGMFPFYVTDLVKDILVLIRENIERYAADIKINFLGRLPSKQVDHLLKDLEQEGIEVERLQFAENFEEYISQQHVVLLPLAVGVGTKNKALTTLGMGVDLIGTPIALENVYGVKEENTARNAEEFIRQMNYRLDSHRLYGLSEEEIADFKEYHSVRQWKHNFWEVI